MPDSSSEKTSSTLTMPPKLRLVSPTSYALLDEQSDESRLQLGVREQLLRAKQLLMQLKALGQTPDTPGLQEHLAMLRLTIRSLEGEGLTHQHWRDVRMVLDVVTRHLNSRSAERRLEQHRLEQRNQLSDWFEVAIQQDVWPMEPLRELAQQLHRDFLFQASPLYWHEASPEDPYLWAAAHGLNTAQVLQRMLSPRHYTSGYRLNAILAGLLHDLGMTRLPAKVLSAQEPTSDANRQQWRSHAVWLAERLRSHLHPEEFDVAQAIAEHHERLDGSGYPQQLQMPTLHPLGRQLAVADTYAALCQPRPHRKAYSPREAVQLILQDARAGRLDDHASLALLPWARWPAGSEVELSDGSTGKIVAWHGHLHSQPVIRIEHGHEPARIVDLEWACDRAIAS